MKGVYLSGDKMKGVYEGRQNEGRQNEGRQNEDKMKGVYLSDPVSEIGILPKVQFTFTWSSGVPLTVHVNTACPPNITVLGDEMLNMTGSAGIEKSDN